MKSQDEKIPTYNCPDCGRFISSEEGWNDRLNGELAVFCSQSCANRAHKQQE